MINLKRVGGPLDERLATQVNILGCLQDLPLLAFYWRVGSL
jgi:hypothetical protein